MELVSIEDDLAHTFYEADIKLWKINFSLILLLNHFY